MKIKLSGAINIYILYLHTSTLALRYYMFIGRNLACFCGITVLFMFQGDGLILDFLFGLKIQSAGQNLSLKVSNPLNKTSDILIPKVILLPSDWYANINNLNKSICLGQNAWTSSLDRNFSQKFPIEIEILTRNKKWYLISKMRMRKRIRYIAAFEE